MIMVMVILLIMMTMAIMRRYDNDDYGSGDYDSDYADTFEFGVKILPKDVTEWEYSCCFLN